MENLSNPNLNILELAAKQLMPLLDDLVFVGGCATGLLISDAAASPIRATRDVDVIVQVVSRQAYQRLSKRLRTCGFQEDTSEDAPICRWVSTFLVLDIMPTDKTVLGFGNPWYSSAFTHAQRIVLPSGTIIKVVSAPWFLMTKLEAFEGRGNGDFQISHDIEDIIVLIDGRPELLEEVKNSNNTLQQELAKRIANLLGKHRFVDAISGHMPPDEVSQNRVPRILHILKQLTEIA